MSLHKVELDHIGGVSELTHELGAYYPHLASIRTRAELTRDKLHQRLRGEIERVVHGFEWDLRAPSNATASPRDQVRAVAWNIERGKRFEPLLGAMHDHELLRGADLFLLNEVDIGMGRSENRNVPRDLARALGLRYVFANSHLVLSPGDSAERDHGRPNTLALHGNALLSRFPLRRFEAVTLPEYSDKFHALEKRLGQKRALLCDVLLPDGPLTIAVVHLDPFSSPRHRARQLGKVLRRIAQREPARVLLGGDLNTTTYDFGTTLGLLANLTHKFGRFGFNGTIEQYMKPEAIFERPLFEVLRRAGYELDAFNDKSRGTVYYDVNDPELIEKTTHYVPTVWWRWLQRKMEPLGGVVPLRLDWFAGHGVGASHATLIERAAHNGVRISDHNPIIVDLAAPTA